MAHGIISTRFLGRDEVQLELYNYNRSFFGSWSRRIERLVSRNKVKRRVIDIWLDKVSCVNEKI